MAKQYGTTGGAGDFQLGKSGPRIKVVSDVVQIRNAGDTLYARSQGATPVVGDDLTTKAYVDAKLGSLPSLDAYDAAGGTVVTGAPVWTDVPLDTNRQIDASEFTHVTPAPDFTWVGVSGTKVLILGSISVKSTLPTTLRGRIAISTGGAFVVVPGATASADVDVGAIECSLTLTAILTLNNGDRVRIQGQSSSPTALVTLLPNGSSVSSTALSAPATGAGSVFDNRGAAITSPAAAPAGTANFTIPLGLSVGTAGWFRLKSVAGSVGGQIQIYSDASRTKLIYNATFTSTSHIEGTPWSSIADDGTDLELDTLYCTVTNSGALTSTYTMEMRFQG